MKTYRWEDTEKKLIKATKQVIREESFSLEDLAEEWKNRKAASQKAKDDIVEFRQKVASVCSDLGITKKDLIGLSDLEDE